MKLARSPHPSSESMERCTWNRIIRCDFQMVVLIIHLLSPRSVQRAIDVFITEMTAKSTTWP